MTESAVQCKCAGAQCSWAGERTDIGIISHTYRAYYTPTHPANMEKTSLHLLDERVDSCRGLLNTFY